MEMVAALIAATFAAAGMNSAPAEPSNAGQSITSVEGGVPSAQSDGPESAPGHWANTPPSNVANQPAPPPGYGQPAPSALTDGHMHPKVAQVGSNRTKASWYASPFGAFTTAHRTLPKGTRLNVCALKSGRCVEVTVRDRGPFVAGRDLDLSKQAFAQIAPLSSGVAAVTWRTAA